MDCKGGDQQSVNELGPVPKARSSTGALGAIEKRLRSYYSRVPFVKVTRLFGDAIDWRGKRAGAETSGSLNADAIRRVRRQVRKSHVQPIDCFNLRVSGFGKRGELVINTIMLNQAVVLMYRRWLPGDVDTARCGGRTAHRLRTCRWNYIAHIIVVKLYCQRENNTLPSSKVLAEMGLDNGPSP